MLAAEMMRSQIRMSIARRRGNSLLGDWLKWNQVHVKAKPTVALEDEEPKPAQMRGPKEEAKDEK